MDDDPFGLTRFVDAQDGGATYQRALAELRSGRKQSHWIWFVFPQVAGLGTSPTAARYAISGLPEARAYLAHPVLGPRLVECTRALLELPGSDPYAVMGSLDGMKLRSSMTLFAAASRSVATEGSERCVFDEALTRYFEGESDPATSSRL